MRLFGKSLVPLGLLTSITLGAACAPPDDDALGALGATSTALSNPVLQLVREKKISQIIPV